ncbi:MAG TPA: hypothetical protein VGM37_12250 [Armatimonadota bacterium]|jgi:hypothetical protein
MDQIRNLLWLKARLSLAGYRKRKGLVFSLVLGAPIAVGAMFGLYFAGLVAFWSLPAEQSRQILNGALSAIYVGWLLGPLLGFSLNEGYDISKLLHYPVAGRTIFLANLLGSAFDKTVLFLAVPLLCIPVALGGTLGRGLLMTAVLAVFLFHTMALSQAVLTLLWGMLRSRRVADVWKVAAALVGTVVGLGYQVMARHMDRAVPAVVLSQPSHYTRFLPSGLAADALMAIHGGDASGAAWRAMVLLLVLAITVALAGGLVQRVAAGDLVLDRVGLAAKPERVHRESGRFVLPSWVPPATAAMFQKEMRTIQRDPQVKIELLQRLAGLIAWPVIMFTSPRGLSAGDVFGLRGYAFLFPMGMLTFMLLIAASNILARDRGGLTLLFTMPAPRRSFFYGKNLAMLLLFTPVNAVLCALVAYGARDLRDALPAFLAGEFLMLMMLGEGNLVSVFNPMAAVERGKNPYTTGRGCSPLGCIGSVAGFLAFVIAGAPVTLAYLAPAAWISPAWFFLTTPLAAVYSVVVYGLSTAWAARALERREPEVLRAILRLPG